MVADIITQIGIELGGSAAVIAALWVRQNRIISELRTLAEEIPEADPGEIEENIRIFRGDD